MCVFCACVWPWTCCTMWLHACVCECMCVCECVLPSDLWGLSSSASSLSLLAWRMNGPLSALPQPLLLVSLSNYLSSSPPSPLFTSVLSYLPTCSSSACTLSSSLPFIPAHPLLRSLSWFDPYFPCFVTPPSPSVTAKSDLLSGSGFVLWPNSDL